MVALTWLRGLVAHRRGAARLDRDRRRRRRGAARVDRQLPVRDHGADDPARRRTRRRSTGRSRPSPARRPERCCASVRATPSVRTRAAGRLRRAPAGSSATAGGTTQSTGPGRVLGLPAGYARAFPGELRTLSGAGTGVLLAQQTAANLHAQPGRHGRDRARRRRAPATCASTASSTCPQADSLFQKVGAPAGAQPQAPPDNVSCCPQRAFARHRSAPVVRTQVHARALARAARQPERSLHARLRPRAQPRDASSPAPGLVGDNLGTALDQARKDALYAQLLFLFLGVPGAILAGLLTAAIAAAGADRRRRDARAAAHARRLDPAARAHRAGRDGAGRRRSASRSGSAAALLIGAARVRHRELRRGHAVGASLWAGGAALAGLAIAAAVDRAARVARRARADRRRPAPRRSGARDRAPVVGALRTSTSIALAGAGARVLAGVAQRLPARARARGRRRRSRSTGTRCSRRCSAGSAPACSPTGWPTSRCARGRAPLTRALRPLAGELAADRRGHDGPPARGCSRAPSRCVALTAAFAASTAVFNSTYRQQAEVDARLTNGADVTVTESPGARVGRRGGGARSRRSRACAASSRSSTASPTSAPTSRTSTACARTRSAPPASSRTRGSRAARAAQLMATARSAARTPCSSAPRPSRTSSCTPATCSACGSRTGARSSFKTVPFHYAGVAKEFPTAPTDSFLVANADYVARATGSDAVGTLPRRRPTAPARAAVAGARARARRHDRAGHRHRRLSAASSAPT